MNVYLLLGALGVILSALAYAVFLGGKWQQASDEKATTDAGARVAKAMADAPDNRAELVDRLRNAGGL